MVEKAKKVSNSIENQEEEGASVDLDVLTAAKNEFLGKSTEISEKSFPEKEEISEKIQENAEKSQISEEKELQYTEVEKEALAQGWLPKDQFEGDQENWRPAKEYIKRGKLLDKINRQNQEIEILKASNDEILRLLKKQLVNSNQTQLDTILKKKQEAIENANVEEAQKYEEEYYKLLKDTESFDVSKKPQQSQNISFQAQQFLDRNSNWFNKNDEMTKYAIAMDAFYVQQYPEWEEDRRLLAVENEVKRKYTEKFNNTTIRSPMVEPKTPPKPHKRTVLYEDLAPKVQKVIDSMIKAANHGQIPKGSREKYVQQALKSGGIRYE